MHGLGFMSAWADYLHPSNPTSLTPQIALGNPTSQNGVQFEGFVEYAYDRLMYLSDSPGNYATNLSSQMISQFGNLGQTFTNASALGAAFISSPAYQLGKYMCGNATMAGAIQQSLPIGHVTQATEKTNCSGPPITLETSFHPFASGSSLNHVDEALYSSTADFLMRYSTPKGQTLQQFIDDYGTSGDSNYGALGPGLRYILAGIGYRIRGGVPLGGSTPNNVTTTGGSGTTSANSTSSGTSYEYQIHGIPKLWIAVYWGILGSWFIFG